MSLPLSRHAYAAMYGPTVGDRVRLGDTDLLLYSKQPTKPHSCPRPELC